MKWENFCECIESLFAPISERLCLKVNKDEGIISIAVDNKEYIYDREYHNKLLSENPGNDNEYLIHNDNYYEILVEPVNDYPITLRMRLQHIDFLKECNDDETQYSIDKMSDIFIVRNFENLYKAKNSVFMGHGLFIARLGDELKNGENINILSVIRTLYRSYLTLKINSSKERTLKEYETLSSSLFFNVAYNSSLVIKAKQVNNSNGLDDVFKINRKNINSINTLQRVYIPELLEQYSTATSSRDPFIQFLCYYHIMEHFYEKVYNEDLVDKLKLEITSPDFSVKNDKSIARLVDIVKRKMKQNKEEFSINELEALELTLKKYIRLDELKYELNLLDDQSINYYNTTKVKFSGGSKLNLNDSSDDSNYKNIAKRIYNTRNALVHYKSSDTSSNELKVYSPFLHKTELMKEIPLMRIISERIIIATSNII